MNVNALFSMATSKRQSLLWGLTALIGILVLSTALSVVLYWRDDWRLIHQTPTHSAMDANDDAANVVAHIAESHLFGQSFSNGGAVPISNLELRVTGIVKAPEEDDTTASKAYISVQGQPSKIYQVGDQLPYGVKIYDITSHMVILENGGQLEKLPLPRSKLHYKTRTPEGP